MSLPGSRFTYKDYRLLPDDRRYEIIEGELLVTPAPSARHQMILTRLLVRVGAFVEQSRLGLLLAAPTDVILAEDIVIQPDLLYVAENRKGIVNPEGGIHGTPDLVVEILSPSTAERDRQVKRKLYAKYGVREYWMIDPPSKTAEVLTLSQGLLETWQVFPDGTTLTSPLLPGLVITVAELFHE